MAPSTEKHLVGLPLVVVGPVDIGRMIRELEQLDNNLLQTELSTKAPATQVPKLGILMEQTISVNKLDILQRADRKQLMEFLTLVKAQAPVVHISFCADPSPAFTEKIMSWLRREIHPLALLTVGLQPNLGAGCIVRTTNKYFDFSLRQDFMDKRELLMSKLAAPEPAAAPVKEPVA